MAGAAFRTWRLGWDAGAECGRETSPGPSEHVVSVTDHLDRIAIAFRPPRPRSPWAQLLAAIR